MIPGDTLTCDQCGHIWTQKAPNPPRACPHCASIRWSDHRYPYRSTRQNGFSKDYYTREEFYQNNPPVEKECPHCGHEWISTPSYRHKDDKRYQRRSYCPKCRKGIDADWVPRQKRGTHGVSAVPPSMHVHDNHLTWCEKFQRGATC